MDRQEESQTIVGLASISSREMDCLSEVYTNIEQTASFIREAVVAAGVSTDDSDAPFADIIRPGMTVLLKPNWVLHKNEGNHGMACMVTHPTFILGALQEVLAAKPGRVIIGDAPVQGCQWEKLVTADFCTQVRKLAGETRVDVIDFRRTIVTSRTSNLITGVRTDARDAKDYVLFDLGIDSLLEPLSKAPGRFRVTHYDPRELAKTHHSGRHQYLLCREAFDVDVILNLPKLKTHRKAGLTAALKNLVGLNGNKDYLPHHRVGGSAFGGDCYPGVAPLKRLAEYCVDVANRNIGTPTAERWIRLAQRVLKVNRRLRFSDYELEGGWHGNDTCWRMVIDLNRILLYGRSDGSLADTQQRKIFSLTDALICGQGEGPLCPEPLDLGAVTFSDCSFAADAIHAALLRLDPWRIPLIHGAKQQFRWPLSLPASEPIACLDGQMLRLDDLPERLGVDARPPRGWVGHVEWELHRRALMS